MRPVGAGYALNEARQLAVDPPAVESVPLRRAAGRVLAGDLAARRTQPPCDVSAMDGYAVRAGDIAAVLVPCTAILLLMSAVLLGLTALNTRQRLD